MLNDLCFSLNQDYFELIFSVNPTLAGGVCEDHLYLIFRNTRNYYQKFDFSNRCNNRIEDNNDKYTVVSAYCFQNKTISRLLVFTETTRHLGSQKCFG